MKNTWKFAGKVDDPYFQCTMNAPIPFQIIRWDELPREEHRGEQGTSFWQTLQLPGLRIRIVEYEAGYLADHWCQKGHVVHCLDGSFVSELRDGSTETLTKGMSYVVSDEMSEHRSFSEGGVKLLIVDGAFLARE
jgi:hypothetical protein